MDIELPRLNSNWVDWTGFISIALQNFSAEVSCVKSLNCNKIKTLVDICTVKHLFENILVRYCDVINCTSLKRTLQEVRREIILTDSIRTIVFYSWF